MRIFYTVLFTIVVLGLSGIGYIYSGVFNVAADAKDSSVMDWALKKTRERSIDRRTTTFTLPASLNPISTEEGFKRYHEMCEICHGGPGLPPTDLQKGLNPTPPDLYKTTEDLTPALVYWVVKHGIKMSGMPSFGTTYDDKELLPVVAFVNRFQYIREAEYRRLLEKQGNKGR